MTTRTSERSRPLWWGALLLALLATPSGPAEAQSCIWHPPYTYPVNEGDYLFYDPLSRDLISSVQVALAGGDPATPAHTAVCVSSRNSQCTQFKQQVADVDLGDFKDHITCMGMPGACRLLNYLRPGAVTRGYVNPGRNGSYFRPNDSFRSEFLANIGAAPQQDPAMPHFFDYNPIPYRLSAWTRLTQGFSCPSDSPPGSIRIDWRPGGQCSEYASYYGGLNATEGRGATFVAAADVIKVGYAIENELRTKCENQVNDFLVRLKCGLTTGESKVCHRVAHGVINAWLGRCAIDPSNTRCSSSTALYTSSRGNCCFYNQTWDWNNGHVQDVSGITGTPFQYYQLKAAADAGSPDTRFPTYGRYTAVGGWWECPPPPDYPYPYPSPY